MKNKGISILLIIVFTALCAVSLSSCAASRSGVTFLVYYTNSSKDDIIYKEWTVDNADTLESPELTGMLLEKMKNPGVADEQYFSVIPEDVSINQYTIENHLLTVDFDSQYLTLTNVDEILLRAAVVLTLIQQPEVSQVAFTVDSNPLTDSSGRAINAMNAGNFVNILLSEEGMLKQETDLTIYFTDETRSKLIPAKYHFTISNTSASMEEYILQQLKTGPAIDSTYRTMAPDVEILSVNTSDNVCYVNFGSNFLEQDQPAGDEILIYSIVNSLCSLPYVSSVQFLVDGSSDVILHTVTDLSKPVTRNSSLEQ